MFLNISKIYTYPTSYNINIYNKNQSATENKKLLSNNFMHSEI